MSFQAFELTFSSKMHTIRKPNYLICEGKAGIFLRYCFVIPGIWVWRPHPECGQRGDRRYGLRLRASFYEKNMEHFRQTRGHSSAGRAGAN